MNDPDPNMIKALSGSNPGALRVLHELVVWTGIIDPIFLLGELHYMSMLDDMGIKGPHIWVLYKDVCGANIAKFIAVLRACQLGFLDRKILIEFGKSQERHDMGSEIHPAELYKLVKDRIKEFDKDNIAAI